MIEAMSRVHTRNTCRMCVRVCFCIQIDGSLHPGMLASVSIRGTAAMRCTSPSRRHALCGHGDGHVAYVCAPAARGWHGCLHSRRSYPVEEVVLARLLVEGEQFRDHDLNSSHHPRDHGEVVEAMVRLVPLLAP